MKKILLLTLVVFLITGCALTAAPSAVQESPQINSEADGEGLQTASVPTTNPSAAAAESQPPIINVLNAGQVREIGASAVETPYDLVFSPDSSRLIVSGQKLVARLTVTGLQPENQILLSESDFLLAVSPAGDLVAATGDHENVDIYSLSAGQLVYSLKPKGYFSSVFFLPESTLLGIVKVDEIGVDVVDYITGNQVNQFRGFETAAPVYNVFPSPDGKTLVWVSRGRIQLMDFNTGLLGPEFSHEDFISGWALSPDGGLLAVSAGGTLDGDFAPLLYLYDARAGTQVAALKLSQSPAMSVAFSPDGQVLAATNGRNILLYRVPDLTLLASLDGPAENISFLAFSPDGRNLAASAQDNLVHLWQVVP